MMSFSYYSIPPLLSLIVGLILAVMGLVKGDKKKVNLLFPLVCIWWSLPSPVYISHYFFSDPNAMLVFERIINFLFVFIVPVNLLFFHRVLGIRRVWVEVSTCAVSGVFALLTQTDKYINGLHCYSWGCIAKAGLAMTLFGIYGLAALLYGAFLCVEALRREKNIQIRKKIKYLLFSILVMGVLMLCNLPAMNGIDLYPAGNFIFIPLIVMWTGVVRHRLMDIRSVLHRTIGWGALSSAIILPNILIFFLIRPTVQEFGEGILFLLLGFWFTMNYLYLKKVQPVIDRIFQRRKTDLVKLESQFVGDIAFLKNLRDLIAEFEEIMAVALRREGVRVFLKDEKTGSFSNSQGGSIGVDEEIEEWFVGADHMAEKTDVETSPYYAVIRDKLMDAYRNFRCDAIIPLVQTHSVLGLVLVHERKNGRLFTEEEIRFINNIRTAVSIALSNSLMYQNLNELNMNLERLVEERTMELQEKNNQMRFELKVASDVQKLILSPKLPANDCLEVAAGIIPMMEVSGDFYSVIELAPGKTAFAVVDVSGHGLPSALLTSMIKSELESQLKKPDRRSSEVCTEINRNLTPHLRDTGFYFTIFFGVIDISGMQLEYTNCGHPAPYIVSPGGEIRELDMKQFPVGLVDDAEYERRTVMVHPGERVVIFSDGIVDARNDAEEFYGDKRFAEDLLETMKDDPGKQVDAVMGRVKTFQGTSVSAKRDDMTLVVVEVKNAENSKPDLKDALKHFKEKRYAEALDILERAGGDIINPLYLFLAGKLHFRMGNLERSLSYIDRALAGDPENLEYLYFRGKALYRCGRMDEAGRVLNRVLLKQPAYKQAKQMVSRITAAGRKEQEG